MTSRRIMVALLQELLFAVLQVKAAHGSNGNGVEMSYKHAINTNVQCRTSYALLTCSVYSIHVSPL